MDYVTIYSPLLTAGLARLQKFNNPEQGDVAKIFQPIFLSACIAARTDHGRAIARVLSWNPADITRETLNDAMRELTAHPDPESARQSILELDMDGSDDPQADFTMMSRATLDMVIARGWARNSQVSTRRAKAGEDERERRDAILENRPYEPRTTDTPCFMYP